MFAFSIKNVKKAAYCVLSLNFILKNYTLGYKLCIYDMTYSRFTSISLLLSGWRLRAPCPSTARPVLHDGRNVNCNRWGGNKANKITQRMKTGNRCLVMCVTCEMGCLGRRKGSLKLVIGSCILVWTFKRSLSPTHPHPHPSWNTITGKHIHTTSPGCALDT